MSLWAYVYLLKRFNMLVVKREMETPSAREVRTLGAQTNFGLLLFEIIGKRYVAPEIQRLLGA